MKTYPDNPDADAQRNAGVMLTEPATWPLFVEIDKRLSPEAQLAVAAYRLLEWKAMAAAIRADALRAKPSEEEELPFDAPTWDQVQAYLLEAADGLPDSVQELTARGYLDDAE
jgi:hypothetical protein